MSCYLSWSFRLMMYVSAVACATGAMDRNRLATCVVLQDLLGYQADQVGAVPS